MTTLLKSLYAYGCLATAVLAVAVVVSVRGGPSFNPTSGLPVTRAGEFHTKVTGVWAASLYDNAGREYDVEVIFQDGRRQVADGPQVLWASRPGVNPFVGRGEFLTFGAADYPVVLFGRPGAFVAARRARDGGLVEPVNGESVNERGQPSPSVTSQAGPRSS